MSRDRVTSIGLDLGQAQDCTANDPIMRTVSHWRARPPSVEGKSCLR